MLQAKHLFPSVIILVCAVGAVRGSSEVTESSSFYSCCNSPTIEFDPSSETTWSIDEKPIAYSNSASNQCIPPCKEVEGGRMMLDECVDVNTTMVSTNEMNLKEEKKILYRGQTCSGSPGNQGSVGLVLLAAAIAGSTVK